MPFQKQLGLRVDLYQITSNQKTLTAKKSS